MTKAESIRYEMLLRVRDFGREHRELFPPASVAGQAFEAVARAADTIARIGVSMIGREFDRKAKASARTTMKRWMVVIVRTMKVEAKLRGGKSALAMPRQKADGALLKSARTFIEAAEGMHERLLELGLPVTYLSEFRDAADDFASVMDGHRADRATMMGGRAGIAAAIRDGFKAARTLDVIVPNSLRDDPERLATWSRDRRVIGGWSKRAAKIVTPPRKR